MAGGKKEKGIGAATAIRQENMERVLLSLYTLGPQTKLELVEHTGLSMSTVSEAINRLDIRGYVESEGSLQSTGGRRPDVYGLSRRKGLVAGLEVTDHVLRVTLQRLNGACEESFAQSLSDAGAREALRAATDRALQAAGGDLVAVGIGTTGAMDGELTGLLEEIRQKTSAVTAMDHRVNARTMAEMVLGAGKGLRHFACLYLDAPEKAGIVADGRLLRGKDGMAGQGSGGELLRLLNLETMISDREDLGEACVVPPARCGEDFSPDCAVMAELRWFHLVLLKLREEEKDGELWGKYRRSSDHPKQSGRQ